MRNIIPLRTSRHERLQPVLELFAQLRRAERPQGFGGRR